MKRSLFTVNLAPVATVAAVLAALLVGWGDRGSNNPRSPGDLVGGGGSDGAAIGPVLFDDFEYDAARDATNAEVAFRARGWTDVKAINSHFRRGSGYLYTRFDPVRHSRVLGLNRGLRPRPARRTSLTGRPTIGSSTAGRMRR